MAGKSAAIGRPTDQTAPAEGFSDAASQVDPGPPFTHGDLNLALYQNEQVPGRIVAAKQDRPLGQGFALSDGHDPVDHILAQSPEQIHLSDVHADLISVARPPPW